jgi:hypothetical protein
MGLRALNKGTPFQPKVVRYTFILIHLTHLYQTLAWTLGASKYTFVRRCISWLTTTISFLAGIENFTPSIDIYAEGSPLNNIQFPLLCFLIKFSRVFLRKNWEGENYYHVTAMTILQPSLRKFELRHLSLKSWVWLIYIRHWRKAGVLL